MFAIHVLFAVDALAIEMQSDLPARPAQLIPFFAGRQGRRRRVQIAGSLMKMWTADLPGAKSTPLQKPDGGQARWHR
jgi:hypothetical protein